MKKAYVVWTTYNNGTGSTECFRYLVLAWMFAKEKRHQGFRSVIEKRLYEVED